MDRSELTGFRTDIDNVKSNNISIKRRVLDIDTGKEALEFKRGGVYRVFLDIECKESVENIVLTDVLPGGFEAENPRLSNSIETYEQSKPDHLEIRDDRVLFFSSQEYKGKFTFSYAMRAVFPGTYKQMPTEFEAMYDPESRLRFGGSRQ